MTMTRKSLEQQAVGREALNRMQDCDDKCPWCYTQYENHLCGSPAASSPATWWKNGTQHDRHYTSTDQRY